MKDITEVYCNQLLEQKFIIAAEAKAIMDDTEVQVLGVTDDGGLQLRFETKTYRGSIFQYCTWKDGRFEFRENGRWFVVAPNGINIVFETFGAALAYLRATVWGEK